MSKKWLIPDDFETDFQVFGIQTNQTDDVVFIFQVNLATGWLLKRCRDIDAVFQGESICYTLFQRDFEDMEASIHIVQNSAQYLTKSITPSFTLFDEVAVAPKLLRKYAAYDYFLKIEAEDWDSEWIQEFIDPLKSMKSVINVTELKNLTPAEKKTLYW
ncbi:MAG: IPExxxVDY family protein [Weeksellaceae bacterium]|nr:IPExxxVDY family protein [Weeksellaceae bacterium]